MPVPHLPYQSPVTGRRVDQIGETRSVTDQIGDRPDMTPPAFSRAPASGETLSELNAANPAK